MSFHEELQQLINRHSMENGSDTPDFLLAEYLASCLVVFDQYVNRREQWYGRMRRDGITLIETREPDPFGPLCNGGEAPEG